jgi:beta-glucosidase
MDRRHTNFPKHFFWGASTAAHQVEGGLQNQWTVWELAHAKEFAQTAHQHLSHLHNWEEIKDQAEEPENYVSGKAVEHYKLYKQDFNLLQQLNMNAFRFTIEWSRIEPLEGQWNEEAIEHYRQYIAELRRRRIEPFMTIWHWTLPVWFADKGGFEKKQNLKYFDRFVKKISDTLIDDLEYIVTLNEPNVDASFSYLVGLHPPAERSIWKFMKVYWNLTRAHRNAYTILKNKKPTMQVGMSMQLANIQAKRPHNYLDQTTTQWMRYFWNWWFLRRIRRHQDFIGMNYYFSDYYTGIGKRRNPTIPLNDMGWYMEPEGIYPLILRVWTRFKKPIFITENGLADQHDQHRQWWIEQTIVAMERAISEGVDLRGYFHWSLLDNFEWQDGWWPKFGLVAVDRENGMKRTIRPSAKWFAELLADIQDRPKS